MQAMVYLASAGAIISLFLCAELAARYLRLADYILYYRDTEIGYAPQPNSSGLLRRRNRWRFNAMGLRSDTDAPADAEAIVLVGDSIVEGGSNVDQDETLAYHLARLAGRRVHPVGGGGWALENEFAFLRKSPELLAAGTFIMVTNSSDLCPINPWSTQSTHPTRPPVSHVAYLVRRISWPYRRRLFRGPGGEGAKAMNGRGGASDWAGSVAAFLASFDGRLIWLLYPSRSEAATAQAPCKALRPVIANRAEIIDLVREPVWGADCYHDDIHPNARGRMLLAELISAAVLAPDAGNRSSGGG